MENLHSIAEVKSYEIVEKITEGCSGDEKYKLRKDGKYFLLRISDKAKTSDSLPDICVRIFISTNPFCLVQMLT